MPAPHDQPLPSAKPSSGRADDNTHNYRGARKKISLSLHRPLRGTTMEKFTNKVILITGSSAGIGATIAQYLAARDARLSLTGRNESRLEDVKKKCVEAGLQKDCLLTTAGDLTDEAFRAKLVKNTVEKFGKLDVLVNNAGIAQAGRLSDPGMDSLNRILDSNFLIHVSMSKLAVPHLQKSKGNIVNISSNLGSTPSNYLGEICITKAAMDMATKVMALELAASGVRVNSVNPGVVRSDIHRSLQMTTQQYDGMLAEQAKKIPMGRVAVPDDIARAVAFMASEHSCFVTGEHLVVDGGERYSGSYKP